MTDAEYPFNQVLVVIANYDFSNNADLLKLKFSQKFRTLLIDASSPESPKSTDITIPNDYYPGLWNAAVNEAIELGAEWLFFIASDVQFLDCGTLFAILDGVLVRDDIGIYTPSLTANSRVSYPVCFNRATAGLRECVTSEGFCFLSRTEILKELYPAPSENAYGWGLDMMASRVAYDLNKKVVVDDRIKIFHPESLEKHAISVETARSNGMAYVQQTLKIFDLDGTTIPEWLSSKMKAIELQQGRLDGQILRSLDLGCGQNPRNTFSAQEVYGVDIDSALNKNNKRILTADLVIEAIPAADNSFDYITAFDFIGHVPHLVQAPDRRYSFIELMNEIWRVLKPGGIFLSVTPAFRDPAQINSITEETFLKDFDNRYRRASIHGFMGYFEVGQQERKDDGTLVTWMRAVREP